MTAAWQFAFGVVLGFAFFAAIVDDWSPPWRN